MPAGSFTFVLHSHLPWVRRAGRWPFGEEWIHQALLDVYLPLLETVESLERDGIRGGITLGVTPVLLEQLRDAHLLDAFDAYLDERIKLTAGDLQPRGDALDAARCGLAQRYLAQLRSRRSRWRGHWQRDVVGALRAFACDGTIEIITSAATHAYLPLLATDSAIDAELSVGIATTQRLLGVTPNGIWLPECAYRGAFAPPGQPGYRPALDTWLAAHGIRYFFVDAHAVAGVYRGSGAWSSVLNARDTAPVADADAAAEAQEDAATLLPHLLPSGVAAFARDPRVSRQVWSRDHGYPGDGAYREFHKRDECSGNTYWRVTEPRVELGDKKIYDPHLAADRASAHAKHFALLVTKLLSAFQASDGRTGMLAAPFDAELFGHWWAEGPQWLCGALRALHEGGSVALTTPSAYLAAQPAPPVAALRESSWGEGGDSRVWYNPSVAWMWPIIHRAERTMERLAEHAASTPRERALMEQAARELLLLASSDWPFLVTTGQARDYAVERFNTHVARFDALAAALDGGAADPAVIEASLRDDTLFPEIDPALFRARALRPLPARQLPLTQPLIARLALA
ncbi:glycoside hydrolase family 57 protein [bacterium]|nr:MAG: glycoside hydrolase family 57 protein [bacterium]